MDRQIHVRIGGAQDTSADAVQAHVHIPVPVQVPNFDASRLAIVGGPLVRKVLLGTLRQQLGPAGNDAFGPGPKLLGELAHLYIFS